MPDKKEERDDQILPPQNEKWFRALVENALDIITVLHADGTVRFESPSIEQILGFKPDDLIGQNAFDYIHSEDLPLVLEGFQRALQNPGTPSRVEFRFRHHDGSWRSFEAIGRSLVDDPDVHGVVVNTRDITKRKLFEEALRHSEERYRQLMAQSPFGILVFKPDGTLAEVNPAWENMWGARAEQVVGVYNPLTDPQVRQMGLLPAMEQAFAGQPVTFPDIFYDPERSGMPGQKRRIRIYAYQIKDKAGEIQNVVVLNEDITEQKQAEEKLKESEANLQAIFNNTLQAFMLFDRQQRLITFNNVADNWSKTMLGRELFKGATAEQIFAGLPMGNFLTAFEQVFQGQIVSRQIQAQTASGNYWFEVSYTPVVANDGLVTGVAFSLLNITERKQLEEQLRQAQKMEAIGRLAGGIAHDFNNILTVISGYTELLLDYYSSQHDPVRQDVEQIRNAAERAASLTHQLLAYSRQQVLQPVTLSLNRIVTDIGQMLMRLIGEDIELVIILAEELKLVKVDPSQIEQVILNLVVNSRDAMPNGGKLTIETANVDLDETYAHHHAGVIPGSYVMLAISDTGQGMDAETQARIFEPFFTTKEIGEGAGLGLATVHGIVNQSGGHIWLYSESGQGTTFKIYLPQFETAGQELERRRPFDEVRQGWETILLVEDEQMVQELARRILMRQGYTILLAGHANEALQIAQQHEGPIHLLLTDVIMPGGLSGRQLAEQLVRLRPETKVLYMSGYTDNAIVHHGVLDPDTAFLEKPFTPDALARKVREVLDE